MSLLQELHLDESRVRRYFSAWYKLRNILRLHVSVTFATQIDCLGATTAKLLRKLSVKTCRTTTFSNFYLETLNVFARVKASIRVFPLTLYVFLSHLV